MPDLASNQIAAISRLFSSTVIREMARRGKSPLFARLACQSLLLPNSFSTSQTVCEFFDKAFSLLNVEGCRHEYIYKTALTQKILLGTHSLQTASMLNEFRVGECKVDLAILNGTATAYEVKSERDSLYRLEKQITAYSKVFASVYVIAAESHVDAVMSSVPKDIGVLQLGRRYRISTLRTAIHAPERTCPDMIFDSIRTDEARMILKDQGVSMPIVPNTEMSTVLRKLFIKLRPMEAHEGMVRALKKTRNLLPLADLVMQLPRSLHTAALSVPMRKTDHARLVGAVNTRLQDAIDWV